MFQQNNLNLKGCLVAQCVFVSILIIIEPGAAFSEMKYIMEDVTVNSIKRLRLRNPGRWKGGRAGLEI